MSGSVFKSFMDGTAAIIKPGEYKAEELRGYAEKFDGVWYAAAYIDRGENRLVFAFSQGKKRNQVIREVMTKAIDRVQAGDDGEVAQ